MLESLKELVCKYNLYLPKFGLVTWTSGNVSARDPETNLVVIKPSGVMYDDLTPDKMVVVDMDGNVIEGNLKPSTDTLTHLYVYKHMPHINAVVHTHSNYATAFAALGQPIKVYLTAIADEFGCEIPCGPYAQIGGEDIGKVIVEYIGESPAILLQNHGVFTIGRTVDEAVKAAVMVEDVAKTVFIAKMMGEPIEIPPDEVKRAHERYVAKYGQK
ncbi:L-ribulose-5-phosphate 4-epimerase [Anaerocellum diazotrophicum]|uniref:L-ribulose-5-phosphate 4-epimerase n=1 Tax=Caldicellulosiruptor diazotrophicus TaxID=2806205 RepID=A0ABN6E4X8_9FIRM|nr:L-ribulose-5-phosphate 4-epimerase [Caldicellulosiruptor diazotrophicus]BCS80412.1 L-ribulose-5-phosphate 4-epimerase [Caldicellulosiruptor diazotrophicus]